MPARKGRSFLLQVDMLGSGSFVTIAGFRENSYTVKAGGVDITNKDSAGWQERLADAGVKSLSVSASGVFLDDAAVKKVRAYTVANSLNQYKLIFENAETVTFTAEVTEFGMSGTYNGEQQYQISLESSGPVVFA